MEQMMKKPRRKFDAGVKAKIALEALRTTQERCPHAHSRNNKCKQQSQPDFEARSSRPLHLNSTGPWSRAWGPLQTIGGEYQSPLWVRTERFNDLPPSNLVSNETTFQVPAICLAASSANENPIRRKQQIEIMSAKIHFMRCPF